MLICIVKPDFDVPLAGEAVANNYTALNRLLTFILYLPFCISQEALEVYKQSSPDDSESKIKFQKAFAKILDDVQSVIDSPHTRKEKREKIVALCENAQDIMKDILEKHRNNKVNISSLSC